MGASIVRAPRADFPSWRTYPVSRQPNEAVHVVTLISQITFKPTSTISKLHRRWNVFLPLASDGLFLVFWRCSEAHLANFVVIQTHPSRRFTSLWISSAYAGTGLDRRLSIRLKIFCNKSLATTTSANWNVTYRPWLTTFAPIFTNFSRSVVRDQYSTSSILDKHIDWLWFLPTLSNDCRPFQPTL